MASDSLGVLDCESFWLDRDLGASGSAGRVVRLGRSCVVYVAEVSRNVREGCAISRK